MYVISYQFKGETVEHKQIFALLTTTLSLVKTLLEDRKNPLVRITISPSNS